MPPHRVASRASTSLASEALSATNLPSGARRPCSRIRGLLRQAAPGVPFIATTTLIDDDDDDHGDRHSARLGAFRPRASACAQTSRPWSFDSPAPAVMTIDRPSLTLRACTGETDRARDRSLHVNMWPLEPVIALLVDVDDVLVGQHQPFFQPGSVLLGNASQTAMACARASSCFWMSCSSSLLRHGLLCGDASSMPSA